MNRIRERGQRLVWDTTTLRKGLQRQVFSSLMEMNGNPVSLVEQTAHELARLMDLRNPSEGLRKLYAGYADPDPIRHLLVYRSDPRITLRHQIWWAEELTRPDGLYRPVILDDESNERYDRLMDSFCTSGALPKLTADEVREHPDAITICQAGAVDGKIVVSPDQDFHANQVATNAWALTRHRAGDLAQDTIVTRPEHELERWCIHEPERALRGIIGAAWPKDPQATRTTVEERFDALIKNMLKVDYLYASAQFCHEQYKHHRQPEELLERTRENLPWRARAADARHPANPDAPQRDWAMPDDAVRQAAQLPRWRLFVTGETLRIEENRRGARYTQVKSIPIEDRDAIVNALVDMRIEVTGTPGHGGNPEGSGGFAAAINALIDAELAKERHR